MFLIKKNLGLSALITGQESDYLKQIIFEQSMTKGGEIHKLVSPTIKGTNVEKVL